MSDGTRGLHCDPRPDGARYERLADAGDEFHEHWEVVGRALAEAGRPLTRQEIQANWTPRLARPHDATFWRWLDRAVEAGLVCRVGKGTRGDPYRYARPARRAGA